MALRAQTILPGAYDISAYQKLLTGKKVAVFANQTSTIHNTHLVDSLVKLKINVTTIFGPEHGFRGKQDAGEVVNDNIDAATGIQVISLYGDHKKPTIADLANTDIVVFDIQDVGVRFYTYISSLEYVMEACLENGKPLLILDRPNPNGFYVDGPVLKKDFKSFVGMQPIPIVYGMTIGEYANMLIGEQWLGNKAMDAYKKTINQSKGGEFSVKVIPCKNYTHASKYILPVNPSPNLKDMRSVYWYPSTCFFEGTVVSEGRGTNLPFVQFGHPSLPKKLHSFTPKPNEGAKTGKLFLEKCYGYTLEKQKAPAAVDLAYFIKVYQQFPDKKNFFLKNNFIDKLAGTDELRKQVLKGATADEIKKSWAAGLQDFKKIRKKYLLYPDF